VTKESPRIWVVDDEPDVLDALTMLLRSADYTVVPCRSGEELLEQIDEDGTGCILLDLRMPGMGGFEVQRELARRGIRLPVVFLSGHGDIPIAVQAIRAGALDFLEKPVRDTHLFAAIKQAQDEDRRRQAAEAAQRNARDLLDSLSQRESEVADLIQAGLRTAAIAERLGLSSRTVEMHRARLLKRLGARTSAEAAKIIGEARNLAGEN
jgi:RNA polymerase sigma factor (sigma-70 family)